MLTKTCNRHGKRGHTERVAPCQTRPATMSPSKLVVKRLCSKTFGTDLDPNADVRRTVALGDDAGNEVEASRFGSFPQNRQSRF